MGELKKAARKADIPPGGAKTVEVAGRVVSIFNVDGAFHAIDDTCPHMGGPLGEGAIQAGIVTCPWHGWRYDVKTGVHCANEAIKVRSYSVKADGEDLLIEV